MELPFSILASLVGAYAIVTSIFLISENRRPQSTLAWMLAFLLAPGIGLVIYFFFGRDQKAFSREGKLLGQSLEESSAPLLAPLLVRQDREIAGLEGGSVSRRKLMMLVRRNSNSALVRTRDAQILQDATAFYPKLIADMKAARHSIHHQYFIWGADAFTEELKEIMIAKAREGVEVRLLYDAVGSFRYLSFAYLRDLRRGGVHVAPTSPIYRLHTISYRNHRKITVIDGTIGYTGGMNVGQEHLDGGANFEFWRDTQIRLVGEAAAMLQAVFMVDWYNAVSEDLFAPAYFPVMPDLEAGSGSGTGSGTGSGSGDTGVPVQILTSGPDSRWAAIQQLYAFMIGTAQHRVFVQSPFFVPDGTISEALKLAALSGVDVRVMVSARASGTALPEWAGNTYFADIVAAGVRVFLYDKGYLHAKSICVDTEVCSIGSANIDIRSFSINYELNAVLYDRGCAEELEARFEQDLKDCREFNTEAYRKLGRLIRFRDSTARLMSPLL